MSRTSILSPTDLPSPSARRVPRPSRGDGWNTLADIEVVQPLDIIGSRARFYREILLTLSECRIVRLLRLNGTMLGLSDRCPTQLGCAHII
jgi:hypothetical protein